MIIPRLESAEGLPFIAEKIRSMITEPMVLDGKRLEVGASIGIALYPDDSNNAGEVLKIADDRMFEEKGDQAR